VQAIFNLPACFSWSRVTAPSFAGSVTLPGGRCGAGSDWAAGGVAAGVSACAVGGGRTEVTAAGGSACGGVAWPVTGAFVAAVAGGPAVAATAGAVSAAGCGGVVVVAAEGEAAAAASVAATPGAGDAGRFTTGACCSLPQADAIGARRRTVASRRTRDVMVALLKEARSCPG
jgi:hypothetical protein